MTMIAPATAASTEHKCPPWCGNDDVGDGSYIVHRSAHKITGDWHDKSSATPEHRTFAIEIAAVTGSGSPQRRPQISISGLADHDIDMDVCGVRALAVALTLAADRAEAGR